MEPRYLIDSNAVIDYLQGALPVEGRVFMNEIVDQWNISDFSKVEGLKCINAHDF